LEKLSGKNAELTNKFTQKVAELNNQITEAIYAGDEQKIDDNNTKYCEDTLAQNSEFKKWIGGSMSGGGWCTTKISDKRSATYKIGTYNSETNKCLVETKIYKCTDWRVEPVCDNGCRTYDTGTVLSSEDVQLSKSH